MSKVQLVAVAETSDGFAIGIIRRRGGFAVVRMNRESQYVVLSAHGEESEARQVANREWALDRAA